MEKLQDKEPKPVSPTEIVLNSYVNELIREEVKADKPAIIKPYVSYTEISGD